MRWLNDLVGARLWIGTQPGDGSGTIGVTRFHADQGRISRVRTLNTAPSPSWLLPAGALLHVVREEGGRAGGSVASYARHGKSLRLLREVPSGGSFPCHLAINERGHRLAVANYDGGVSILPLDERGSVGDAPQAVLPSPAVPGASRPHCVAFRSDSLWIADYAADCLWVAREQDGFRNPVGIPLSPGTGPRTLAFHPGLPRLFVVGERDNSLTVLSLADTTAEVIARNSLLPGGDPAGSAAAHVEIHPRLPMLYLSIRGTDTITSFRLTPSGDLGERTEVSSGGRHPRHFCIDPSGRWLLVANRDSDRVSILPLDGDGRPGEAVSGSGIRAPSCVTFVNDS